MPLYQMICIAAHFPEYVSLHVCIGKIFHELKLWQQQHIRSLVQQSATQILQAGGVVRKIESWGTLQLPQRMKKKRTNAYEYIGEYVVIRLYLHWCHTHVFA
jgi:small subunit ribosomal protein S6